MDAAETIKILQEHQDEFKTRFGVKSLFLFGSLARNETEAGSDVDLLVEFISPPGFDKYMDLKFRLEELLGNPVDLVMKKALRPEAVPVVEKEAVRVA